MYNRDAIRKALMENDNYKELRPKTSRWSFVTGAFVFEDGNYRIRLFWPHPEKCPDGFFVKESYKLEKVPGDGKEKAIEVLAPSSCHPPKMEKVYLAERILFQIAKRKLISEFTPGMKAAISLMTPEKRAIWPVAVWGDTHVIGQRQGKDKNASRTYDDYGYKPGDAGPHPLVWTHLTYATYSKEFFKCFFAYEDKHGVPIFDMQRGAYITMQKSGNNILFVPHDPSPAPAQMLEQYATMYNIAESVGKAYKEPAAVYALLQNIWFRENLEKFGIDLRKDHELPADQIIPDWESLKSNKGPETVTSGYATIREPDPAPAAPSSSFDLSALMNAISQTNQQGH